MKHFVLLLAIAVCTACTEQQKTVWYKGNTHTHTSFSDGDTHVNDVVKWYHDNGYHFLFVSDHNYPLQPDSLQLAFTKRSDFLLIPGNEVSDEMVIHTSALNTTVQIPLVNYYRTRFNNGEISEDEYRALSGTRAGILAMHVKNILEAGGIPVLNHPNFVSGVQVADILPVKELKHLELFNGHPQVYNWGNDIHSAVEIKWDSLLIHGKLLYGVASDDEHQLKKTGREMANPGRGWIMARASSFTAGDILNAIRSGDFYSSTGVFLKDYKIENNVIKVVIDEKTTLDEINAGRGYARKNLNDVEQGFKIEFIGYNGKILKSEKSSKATYTIQPNDQYVRVRISYRVDNHGDIDTYYAWTQPVEAKKGFFANTTL